MTLNRFVAAQDEILDQVRAELTLGCKRTHWMWFVFPQIAGLGSSPLARQYAIENLAEARRYLLHPALGTRLSEMTGLLLDWAGRRSAIDILGSIDAMKLRSSMTLFEAAARGMPGHDRFGRVIDAFFEADRDERTLRLLALENC